MDTRESRPRGAAPEQSAQTARRTVTLTRDKAARGHRLWWWPDEGELVEMAGGGHRGGRR
jgi:hypothetical protein